MRKIRKGKKILRAQLQGNYKKKQPIRRGNRKKNNGRTIDWETY